ncbi:MAG TPA: D-alanine--D-alanine ligase [Candidatus Paceibacterota bacterium]|nr:D-alanine--D-alanine ligase [Candidatus Paceibacterota bacterium]
MKNKIRVAVLRGGPSSEYEVSLKTGDGVLKNLPEKYHGIDVMIDKQGVWHVGGLPIKPEKLIERADVAFLALHGEYGEDGTVQRFFETHNFPFTGSKALASALGMNKALSKKVFIQHKIPTAHYRVIEREKVKDVKREAIDIFKTFIQPCVIKPNDKGSSVGVSICETAAEIEAALEKVFAITDKAVLEECIKGKEGTCGVLEHFRHKEVYALPPIEIRPKSHQKFFDYESKYSTQEGADEICPGNFTRAETEAMEKYAIEVHKAIGARHYSRTDFMVHPKRGVFVLEINTLPGLTPTSLIPKEMVAVGSSYSELIDHLLTLALEKK